ncbi:S-adenosyl-L-methionine-dependent methyltransferase [Nemania sp. NC0429]|nr:S-adenosyl-L-methionine-dependent methyltransferase [Nemania sp. NC0429]
MAFLANEALALTNRIDVLLNSSPRALGALDADIRHKLSEAARKLSLATEATGDTVHRIVHSPLQLPLALVGVETRLFEILAERGQKEATNAELASLANVDPVLTKRLLRYYQSFGMVDQPSDDRYRANNITSAMVSLGGRAGVPFGFETLVPAFNALPEFLRKTSYANVIDGANCPWHLGRHTDKQAFEWVKERPDILGHFTMWMANQRDGLPMFLDVINFEQEFCGEGVTGSTPIFVDVGGALGHQCIALRQKYPGLVGRIILQDREEVIQQARERPIPGFEGIETQPYDFFTPQPIKGARAYYMRNILHDWPDSKCVEILKNIKSAMAKDSRILIDEMVLPERGASWRATQSDLLVSTCFASTERSRADWDSLLGKAGLTVSKVWKYTDQLDDCVIVAVPN